MFPKMLVSISNSQRCIEIGVFHGYSALAIAEALFNNNSNNNNEVNVCDNNTSSEKWFIACDIDAKAMKIAKMNFKRAHYDDKVGYLAIKFE